MWLEYFRTISSIRHRSAYSLPASFRCRVTVVPAPSRSASAISYSPLPSLVHFHAFSSPILRRDHLHGVRHHEGGVEAHAELADEARALLRVRRHGLDELPGPRARDGARGSPPGPSRSCRCRVSEMVSVFLSFVSKEMSMRGTKGHSPVLLLREGEVLQLVQRVGRVGDELPEEDLRVGVQRVDDEREKLVDFGLELVLGHGVTLRGDCFKQNYSENAREVKRGPTTAGCRGPRDHVPVSGRTRPTAGTRLHGLSQRDACRASCAARSGRKGSR